MGFSDYNILYLLFLIPLLLFLYILRLRRKVQIVSSNILWDQSIEDIKANTLFQKLRRNLLLPLQVLILTLIILALARPFIIGSLSSARNLIVILDASASMNATDVKESRFDFAKSSIMKMIDELDKGVKMTIIRSGNSPAVISDQISDKSILKDSISKQKPSDTSANLVSAIRLAESLAKDMAKSEIVIFSDGAGEISKQSIDVDIPVRFVKIGKEDANNIGITDLGVIEDRFNSNQVFAVIQNFSDTKSQSTTIELYHDKDLIDAKKLNLPKNGRRSVIFDNVMFNEGVIKVSIDAKDELSVDNSAYYILHKPRQFRTLLIGESNIFLEKAIETSLSGIKIDKENPENYISANNYDLVIFENFVPKIEPNTNVIYLNPNSDLLFAKFLSTKENPAIMKWDRSHPLMRFVDLSELRLDYVKDFRMPAWMVPLAESDNSSLIWYGKNKGHGILVLPFDIRPNSKRNFALIPAFPVFISNALDFMIGMKAYGTNVKAGEPINYVVSSEKADQQLFVKKPDGSEVSIRLENGVFTFADTDITGAYQVVGKGIDEKFSVSFLNESESDIKPYNKIMVSGQEIQSSGLSSTANREFWATLVLLAIMLLVFEWWVYHRRVLV